jgi:nucleotide-binding universal stress UspA family protein
VEEEVTVSIVVGYVPTPEGRAALRRAAAEAELRSSRLVVVNSHAGGKQWDGEEAMRFEDELTQVRERLDETGVQYAVRTLVRGQDPSEDLIDVAAEEEADLIVIGLRRRTPVGKLILGSNAQEILLGAECAVLAVKASG